MSDIPTLVPKDRREFVAERIRKFILDAYPGKELEVIVRKRKRERTSPQNRYLWGVAYKLLTEATGYEIDDVAEYLCGTYFGWKDKPMPGKRTAQVPIRTTTTDQDGNRDVLSKQDFGDYVGFVQRFGAKHGVLIPDPTPEEVREAA